MKYPMSAYVCKTETFARIYTGLQIFNSDSFPYTLRAINDLLDFVTGLDKSSKNNFARIITELYVLNVEAVNERYGETATTVIDEQTFYEICCLTPCGTFHQFYKTIECLHYQMSEGTVSQTELYKLVGNLMNNICIDIVHKSNMYNEAKWG